ncbi:MAG: ribonuclease D [Gammaproteobacteria bacterium]
MQSADFDSATYIDSNVQLAAYCQNWARQHWLALDTEFIRTNTFYPRLGLLQIADESGYYLADPLAIDDWTCFTNLFADSGIRFVLHSCSEDLNLFTSFFGQLPISLFDTQLAAAFLGSGFSLSYQALVEDLLEVELPQSQTRSDWLHRPLSPQQLRYATADVAHLLEVSRQQFSQLEQRNLLQWFEADCAAILKQAQLAEQPASWQGIYTGISNAWRLNDDALKKLQRLCVWREQEARYRDKPRSWIAKDGELLLIARELGSGQTELDRLYELDLDRRMLSRYGKKIIDAMEDESLASELPDRSELSLPLTSAERKLLKACQSLTQERASQYGMAPEVLGRKRWLMELIHYHRQHGTIDKSHWQQDWRVQILNPELNAIFGQQ